MIPVCDLCDAWPDLVRPLDPVFRSFGGNHAFFGPVETIRTHEDNSRVREAASEPGEGRVLVVDGGGSLRRALLGGDLARALAAKGWAGVILYGAVRDSAELEAEPLGVLALGLCPVKTEKRGLGERGVPVSIAGAVVTPGAFVYVDRDGAIIAPRRLHD